ncbi:MAG: class I SAM-dependent methyltransferase [Putridiphycobacter sp.]
MGKGKIRDMDIERKPFQGVKNIILFNWHFYVIAVLIIAFSIIGFLWINTNVKYLFLTMAIMVTFTLTLSTIISFYIYDQSKLYELSWLELAQGKSLLNINAGFDETSQIIQQKFPHLDLSICDFYDPKLHTEISIKRARKHYPPQPNTQQISTHHLPFDQNQFHNINIFFSAHEIRNHKERVIFFNEINRVLKENGEVYVIEHLRNLNNFLAYNIGFFHFLTRTNWLNTFENSNFRIHKTENITPFVYIFILKKNDPTA